MSRTVVFESDSVKARHVFGSKGSPCVITFANYDSRGPTTADAGFGEAFLQEQNLDAILVTCAGNKWFQYPEAAEMANAIRRVVTGYSEVVTYGSSMGGYAALRFAGGVGATRVVAISPQVSINPFRAPFETRWAEAETISFITDDKLADIPLSAEVFALYDPYNLDALQMDLLRRVRPVTELRAPFAGHGAATLLRDGGYIKPMTTDLLTGRFNIDAWPSIRRECRYRAPLYWMNLSLTFLDRRNAPAAVRSAERANALDPRNLVIKSVLGTALRRSGRHAEAIVVYEQMIAADSKQEARVARALSDSRSKIGM